MSQRKSLMPYVDRRVPKWRKVIHASQKVYELNQQPLACGDSLKLLEEKLKAIDDERDRKISQATTSTK